MKLEASKRGPGKPNALRNQGILPAIVYNKEMNEQVSVNLREFDKVFRKQGQSGIIDLDIEGTEVEVLVKQVQMNKRKRLPQHIDFYAITRGQTVQVSVSVDYIGTAAGVKEGGQLDIKRREVLIDVLPRLIPEKFDVDISHMEVGDVIHVSEVEKMLPEGATLMDNPELTLLTIVAARVAKTAEEEAAEAAAAEAGPEVIGADSEEGEAEGEAGE